MSTVLEVEGLSVRYHRARALSDVSICIAAGEITTVIGPNGAGKTSLVNAVMGLCLSTGRIYFPFAPDAARSVEGRIRAQITLVPETRDLFGPMTVRDNLRLGAYSLRRHPSIDPEARIAEVFRLFPRLQERQRQLAHTLSGGERQMLALGRALMLGPRLLMLDEPSLGLAPLIAAEIFKTIERLRDDGVSILLIEQNARSALRIADRAYVLENGTVQLNGKACEIAADPRVIESYLGIAATSANDRHVDSLEGIGGDGAVRHL
jgi:branched-chain amino acid transport system ATP-binding protein